MKPLIFLPILCLIGCAHLKEVNQPPPFEGMANFFYTVEGDPQTYKKRVRLNLTDSTMVFYDFAIDKSRVVDYQDIEKIIYINTADKPDMTDIWIGGILALGLKDNHLYQIFTSKEEKPIIFEIWRDYQKEFLEQLSKKSGVQITYPGGFQ